VRRSIKKEARYRLALSTGIILERHAMYEALVIHAGNCICKELAEHLLREAHWDREEFIASYEAGDLDD